MRMKKLFLFIFVIFLLSSCSQTDEPDIGIAPETEAIVTTHAITDIIEPPEKLEDPNIDRSKYPQLTNLPTLYIELDNDVAFSTLSRSTFVSGQYTLVNGDDIIYEQILEIKGRGNYSWSFPQKPYALKLDSKADLLGNDQAAKRWVLVTTYSDKTLLRNFMTMKLAYSLGAEFTTECMYVDLYTNGEYNGTYVLMEKIQINEHRVNIDKSTGALFEIEMEFRHSGACHYCINLPSGVHMMFVDPDEDDTTTEELDKKYIEYKTFLNVADISLTKGYDQYSQYIDVNSFVDWYIVNEFAKNYDSNFTTSCYCFINDNGKLTMGPVWDYDTCYGNQDAATCMNPRGFHVTGSPWFGILTEDETFKELLHKRWTELRDAGAFDDFIQLIHDTVEYISASEVLDHEKWSEALRSRELRGGRSLFTYAEEVDYFLDWIDRRLTFLDSAWYID